MLHTSLIGRPPLPERGGAMLCHLLPKPACASRHIVTKLSGLTKGMAAILGVPEATVTIAVKRLRANGLLNTGPRGPGSPVMGPRDAANILLALMWNDQVTTDHLRVPELRAAPLHNVRRDGQQTSEAIGAPYPFLYAGERFSTLGEMLDGMIDEAVCYGGTGAKNLSLSLSRPGTLIDLFLHDDDHTWDFQYIAYDDRFWMNDAGPDGKARMVPRGNMLAAMSYSTSIDFDALYHIAVLLRGRELADDEHECTPPYAAGATQSAAFLPPSRWQTSSAFPAPAPFARCALAASPPSRSARLTSSTAPTWSASSKTRR